MSADFELGAWAGLLVLAAVAFVWAGVLARRAAPQRRLLRGVRVAAVAVPVVSLMSTVWVLRAAFLGLREAPPEGRSSALATKISQAMALTTGAYVVLAMLLLTLLVLTIRLRSAKQ